MTSVSSSSVDTTPTKQAGSELGDDTAAEAQDQIPVSPLPEAHASSSVGSNQQQQPARPDYFPSKTTQTLSSSTDGLVLFDLTNEPGGNILFSPNTIKSIVDLKLLNVGYERQRLSFVQIRSDLEYRIAQGVTVPSVELSDGSHLMDSWKIAEYLETKHPQGHLLFPNSSVKSYAAFITEFSQSLLAPHLRILAAPHIYKLLDAASQDYYKNTKIGASKFHRIVNASQEEKQSHIETAVKVLGTVESALAAVQTTSPSSSSSPRWLAGTEQPSHADACLFGWYVYTRPTGKALTKEIWSAHPHVAKWVEDMLSWCGPEITQDFV